MKKLDFEHLLKTLDIEYDNSKIEKFFNIFSNAVIIIEKENYHDNKNYIAICALKTKLRKDIRTLSLTENNLLSLIINKLIHEDNAKITPIEWLTCESLIGLLSYPDDAIFPVTGENLFKEWNYLVNNKEKDKIKILKFQIKHISLTAKNLIYREIIKWDVKKYDEATFDLFLTFISLLREEEVKELILRNKKVA